MYLIMSPIIKVLGHNVQIHYILILQGTPNIHLFSLMDGIMHTFVNISQAKRGLIWKDVIVGLPDKLWKAFFQLWHDYNKTRHNDTSIGFGSNTI